MAQIDFTPLIKRTIEDQEFGSRLIAFAKAHGLDLLGNEDQLSEEELDDIAGGVSSFELTSYELDYEVQPLSIDVDESLFYIGGGGGAGKVS